MDHDRVKLVCAGELVRQKGKPLVGCLHGQAAFGFGGCNNPNVAAAVSSSGPYIGHVLHNSSWSIFVWVWCTWPGFHPAFGISKGSEDPVSQLLVGQTGEDRPVPRLLSQREREL